MGYSNSAIQSYKSCPLQFKFRYIICIQKIEEGKSEHHLVYGKAFHAALKAIYLKDSLEHAKQIFKDSYPIQLDETDKAKTQANGLIALDLYTKRWMDEDKKWKVIQVEDKDKFDYEDPGFTVILDLVMENIQYGGFYGFDHKVIGGKKAYINEEFWRSFEPNSQVTKYYSYIKSKHGDCSGFYINAIGMGFRERMYKGEPAGFWVRFGRMMFNRNETHLRIEQGDTRYWIDRIEQSTQSGCFGMNTDSCRWCQYSEICKAGWTWEEDRELIEINYVVVPREHGKVGL